MNCDHTNNNIYTLLQFAGGTFPGGGFSQSWGLETYVSRGVVHDEDTLMEFLSAYIDAVISKAEGPLVLGIMKAFSQDDTKRICDLETLSLASKLTKESRESSVRMGNAFLRISDAALKDKKISEIYNKFKSHGITYPTAYGIVMQHLNINEIDALSAYVFNSVNAIVQSAVKLIPLGNTDAQKVIIRMGDKMDKACEEARKIPADEIVTFCPGLDIAGMEHETLSVRLYMT